jgi:PAS domain-containing protein
MQRDGMVREFEYQVRRATAHTLALRQRHGRARRCRRDHPLRRTGTRHHRIRKRAEDAIAEGRRLLQQVIDTVPAVINVKDSELRYVLMNRYMAGIFGIEPADAIGRTTTD